MIWFSMPVFLLMLGASVLGFLLSWVWVGNKLDRLHQNFLQQQDQFQQVQHQYHDLLEHSNSQQGEKEKLIQKLDDVRHQMALYQEGQKKLEEERLMYRQELQSLQKRKSKQSLPRQITGELASLRSQIDELTQEKENWREKYMIVRQANDEHLAQLSALGKQQDQPDKIDWREEYHQMQLSLNKKLDELKEAKQRQRREYLEMKQHYAQELENVRREKEQQKGIGPNSKSKDGLDSGFHDA